MNSSKAEQVVYFKIEFSLISSPFNKKDLYFKLKEIKFYS